MRAITTTFAFLVAVTAGSAIAQDGGSKLTVQKHAEYGDYLADAQGRALYLFEADTQGKGDAKAVSTCKDDCLAAWPPLVASGTPEPGEGAAADLIGTLQRDDGTMQVTYNGWPLYYYHEDEAAGDTKGHDIEEFGAEWYLLTPAGEKAED